MSIVWASRQNPARDKSPPRANLSGRPVGAQAHQPQRRARLLRGAPESAGATRAARGVHRGGSTISDTEEPHHEVRQIHKIYGRAGGSIDLNDLVNQLSDFFLQSGFENQYYGISEMDRSTRWNNSAKPFAALEEGDLLPDDVLEQMLDAEDSRRKWKS